MQVISGVLIWVGEFRGFLMKSYILCASALSCFAFAAPALSVQAALPPANTFVSLYNLGINNAPGSYSGVSQSGGSESGTLSISPQATLTAHAAGSDYNMFSAAISHLGYWYEVVGPVDGTSVNLQMTGSLEVSTSSTDGYAKAFISAGVSGINKTLEISSQGDKQLSPTWSFLVDSGQQYYVDIQANASGNDYDGLGYSSYAFADPIISFVGPHDGYSLIFSPGVGNGPEVGGVPEPATWALMLGGFGVVGSAMRRRRQGPAAVAS